MVVVACGGKIGYLTVIGGGGGPHFIEYFAISLKLQCSFGGYYLFSDVRWGRVLLFFI